MTQRTADDIWNDDDFQRRVLTLLRDLAWRLDQPQGIRHWWMGDEPSRIEAGRLLRLMGWSTTQPGVHIVGPLGE